MEKVIPSDEFDVFYNDVQLPTLKFLPGRYVLESLSLEVEVRSATKDDMPRLYALMKSVADTGHGYGIDEFPTLNAFREMTRDVYIIVVEEKSSRKVRMSERQLRHIGTSGGLILKFVFPLFRPPQKSNRHHLAIAYAVPFMPACPLHSVCVSLSSSLFSRTETCK